MNYSRPIWDGVRDFGEPLLPDASPEAAWAVAGEQLADPYLTLADVVAGGARHGVVITDDQAHRILVMDTRCRDAATTIARDRCDRAVVGLHQREHECSSWATCVARRTGAPSRAAAPPGVPS